MLMFYLIILATALIVCYRKSVLRRRVKRQMIKLRVFRSCQVNGRADYMSRADIIIGKDIPLGIIARDRTLAVVNSDRNDRRTLMITTLHEYKLVDRMSEDRLVKVQIKVRQHISAVRRIIYNFIERMLTNRKGDTSYDNKG